MRVFRTIAPMLTLAALFWALAATPVSAEDTDETCLRQAFAMAKEAMANGNPPFGAVLVKDGQVIARTPNTADTDHNISHHAETNCLSAAARKLGYWGLEGATLYSSCEPCEMCCGLIFLTGVKKLVYGLSAERFARMTGFRKAIPAKTYFKFAKDRVEVVGPLLEDEGAAIIEKYLADHQRRKKKQESFPMEINPSSLGPRESIGRGRGAEPVARPGGKGNSVTASL